MREKRAIPTALLVAALAVMQGGCASQDTRRDQPKPVDPSYRQGDDRPQSSLVFPSPQLRAARNARAQRTTAVPWYADRNDVLPGVDAGARSAIFESTVTYTVDRQSIHGDHVRDYVHDTTYRTRVFETVR